MSEIEADPIKKEREALIQLKDLWVQVSLYDRTIEDYEKNIKEKETLICTWRKSISDNLNKMNTVIDQINIKRAELRDLLINVEKITLVNDKRSGVEVVNEISAREV